MTDTDSMQFLVAFQKGDQVAFEEAFKLFYKPLRIQAYLILNNKEDAEDQVQQLFLDIWNRQLYRNVHDSIKSYLFTSIRNRCLNRIASETYKSKALGQYAETIADIDTSDYQEPVLRRYLQNVLDELPRQRLRAFHLVYLEDKKYIQAAEEMGISINSLKSHLKLAVKFLKEQVKR